MQNLSYIFSSPRAFNNYLLGARKGKQLKGRHAGINICDGFHVSFFTKGLSSIYELGKEIEVYQGIEDLKFKLDYYLENEIERLKIATARGARAQEYLYIDVMKKLFHRMGLN